mgnify:CR=1 FL=1
MSLIDNIKESEGFRDKVYQCTQGYDTIGYGFAIKDLILDEDIADMILERKLLKLEARIDRKFPFVEDLPRNAKDVVIEMCYQLGVSGFSKFKQSISLLRLGNYKDCADELLNSRWARQTPNRANKLADIMRNVR